MILTRYNIDRLNFEYFLNSKILSEHPEKILLVVPTNRRLRDLKKKIINHFIDRPVSKIYIDTLTTLTSKMLRNNKSFISLSEAAASVLLKESTEELELSYFAAYNKSIPFGTLDKIKNVISEYKRHGVTPDYLIHEAKKLEGGERNKAVDIASIYKLYLEKCKELVALEVGDIYSELLNLNQAEFQSSFKILYPEVETIVFDEFDEFTNLEIDIIEKLSEAVDDNLYIKFDFDINNKNLFSHLSDTFQYLKAQKFRSIFDTTPKKKYDFNNAIKVKLFSENKSELNEMFIEKLNKYKAKNRIEEVEYIAKSIKQQLINKEVEPQEICVAFNIISNYSSLIRDTFHKYGIPINLTDRIPLKTSPPVIAAISLLELAENDFYFYDLGRVLTNGFFSFENIDFNNLLSVASELKITSGVQNWHSSLQDGISILSFREDLRTDEKNRIVNNYKNAVKDIKKLSTLLLPFREKTNSEEFVKNFKDLLLRLRLPFTVLEDSVGKEEEYIKSITVLLKTLTEVLDLLDKNDKKKLHSLQFYIEQIQTISIWERFNTKERSDQGVLVTSVNEIRGLKFKYLYLGGLCDGDFPTRYSPEIFLSSSYQKKEQFHQTEERFHFYQALSTWEDKLFITIPQKDSEAELVESTFVKDLEKFFKFSEINYVNPHSIFSPEQLQIEYAKNPQNENLIAALKEYCVKIELESKKKIGQIRRDNPFAEIEFNGFISTDQEINNYLDVFSGNEFSVSQLEIFAKCPFKYFAERILNLHPIEEPTEEAQPLELGNVLHSILYAFYTKLINEKIRINRRGTKEFAELTKLLFEIAEEKINSLNLNSPLAFFEKEKIMGIEGVKENSILYKFLDTEINSESDFSPKYFEFSFGNFSNSEKQINIPPLEIGKIKLRGKVDRIDVDEEKKVYNVIDYKLKGSKPTGTELWDGISLQLPVYLMAGKHILKKLTAYDYSSNKMTIYSLDYKDRNFGPNDVNINRKKNISVEERQKINEELTEVTKQKITAYHKKIKEGHFHLSSLVNREEKVCKYCDFKSLCRVKEVFEV